MNVLIIFFLLISKVLLTDVFNNNHIFNEERRIVGGEDHDFSDYQYLVGIAKPEGGKDKLICGGTLINSEWILTAAVCVFHRKWKMVPPENLSIVTHDSSGVEIRQVNRIVIHPKFETATFFNNLALLRLSIRLHNITYVHLARFTEYRNFRTRKTAQFVGLGLTEIAIDSDTTDYGFDIAEANLRTVTIPLMPHVKCQYLARKVGIVLPPSVICGVHRPSGKRINTCLGDMGGPLLVDGVQIGILARRPRCNKHSMHKGIWLKEHEETKRRRKNIPGIYTRVDFYRNWILFVINGSATFYSSIVLLLPYYVMLFSHQYAYNLYV